MILSKKTTAVISIIFILLFIFLFIIYKSFSLYSQKEVIEYFKLNEIKIYNIKFEYYTASKITLFYFKANYISIDEVRKYLEKHGFIKLDIKNLGEYDSSAVNNFFNDRYLNWWHPSKDINFQIYAIKRKLVLGKYIYYLLYLDENDKTIFIEITMSNP